jgi:hypothetical protein
VIKKTTTVYTISQPAGTSLTVHLDGDFIVIRNLWANDTIESEVNIHATRGTVADLVTAFSELESEVIGE